MVVTTEIFAATRLVKVRNDLVRSYQIDLAHWCSDFEQVSASLQSYLTTKSTPFWIQSKSSSDLTSSQTRHKFPCLPGKNTFTAVFVSSQPVELCRTTPPISNLILSNRINWCSSNTRTQKVLGSYLDRGTGNSELYFFIFLSVPLSEWWESKVKISLLQAVEAPRVARGRGSHIT
jgi:hypothetical protein